MNLTKREEDNEEVLVSICRQRDDFLTERITLLEEGFIQKLISPNMIAKRL